MPTYEYACRSCGEHLEVVQSFRDDPLTTCPNCEGALKKVFSAAGIIFKGSGWHIKDYGAKSGSAAGGSSDSSGSGDSSGSADTGSSKDAGETSKGSGDSGSSKGAGDGGSSKDTGSASSSSSAESA